MAGRKKKNPESSALIPSEPDAGLVDENALFERVAAIIENRKGRAGALANREVTLMYWEVGRYLGSVLLDGERAAYGKRIVATLSQQLSRSHILELLPLKTVKRNQCLMDCCHTRQQFKNRFLPRAATM